MTQLLTWNNLNMADTDTTRKGSTRTYQKEKAVQGRLLNSERPLSITQSDSTFLPECDHSNLSHLTSAMTSSKNW